MLIVFIYISHAVVVCVFFLHLLFFLRIFVCSPILDETKYIYISLSYLNILSSSGKLYLFLENSSDLTKITVLYRVAGFRAPFYLQVHCNYMV